MAGTFLSVGVVLCAASLTVALAGAGGAAVFSQRMAGAADAAALAAADAASGAITGVPCDRAVQVAAATGAAVSECAVVGLIATVTVTASFGVFTAVASARAGPPP